MSIYYLSRVLFVPVLILGMVSTATGTLFDFTGQYTGEINGVPIIATGTGELDTTGLSVNHIDVTFESIPSTIHPYILGLSWNTSRCVMAVQPVAGAQNLFDLSGGNYIASRMVKWSMLSGDEIVVDTIEVTSGDIMSYDADVNGTYSGPVDIVGVSDYSLLWTQLGPTSIEVSGTALLLRENGESFTVELSTVYTGLSTQMPYQQQGMLTFSNLTFNDNVLSFDWQGTVAAVPEPGTLALFAYGIILIRPRGRRAE